MYWRLVRYIRYGQDPAPPPPPAPHNCPHSCSLFSLYRRKSDATRVLFAYIMMQDVDELNRHDHAKSEDDEEEEDEDESSKWEPSGSWWKDFLYFSGPGEEAGAWTTEPTNHAIHSLYQGGYHPD